MTLLKQTMKSLSKPDEKEVGIMHLKWMLISIGGSFASIILLIWIASQVVKLFS